MRSRLKTDILALALLSATVFVAISLGTYDLADPPGTAVFPPHAMPQNAAGPVGAKVALALLEGLGVSAYLLLIGMAVVSVRLFLQKTYRDPLLRLFGLFLVLSAVSIATAILYRGPWHGPAIGAGGYLGAWGWAWLTDHLTAPGLGLLLGCAFVSGMLLTTDYLMFHALSLMVLWPFVLVRRLGFGRTEADQIATVPDELSDLPAELTAEQQLEQVQQELEAAGLLREIPVRTAVVPPPKPKKEPGRSAAGADSKKANATAGTAGAPGATVSGNAVATNAASGNAARKPIKVNPPNANGKGPAAAKSVAPPPPNVEFELPPLDLLEEAEEFPYEYLSGRARIAAATLEKTFQEFGLNVKVVEIDTGPVITQFELELEAGLRLNKVTALADDLAIALRVPSVRVVAPIPGKNTVGVEVPNDKRVMVRLKEIIESSAADRDKLRIPLFLGKDVSGQPMVVDMSKMPHLLIAGRTGTGKSVCLNTLILSILTTRSPDDVKLLLIDPKMVELSPYMRVPHLMHPVITDMKKAEAVLAWAVDKMEERYDLLARCGVRHLDSYNQMSREDKFRRLGMDANSEEAESIPERMPYIVIVADEFADLIMTSGKDVEAHIIRLAQKSRAVGIHLVLATQKPTVDVITGLIKSNLPARISFQVSSRMDSRVVLDEMGAEKLLGNGDMLYLAPGTSKISRAQGTYVSDEEVMRIVDFYSDCPPQYSAELAQLKSAPSGKTGIDAIRARDEMYEPAIEVVIREGRGSVSLLQRCLGIGYGRAARLIDYMAEDGIVGDYNGSQAREVLFTPEQWASFRDGGGTADEFDEAEFTEA